MNRVRLFLVLLVAAIASSIISYFVTVGCLNSGYCLIAEDSSQVTMVEAMGFAGTMATILAFVATFAIALMAIDAFAISSTVRKSSDSIERFSTEVEEIESRLRSVSASVSVMEWLVREIDEASEYDDHIYSLFEVISRSAGAFDVTEALILNGRNSSRDRRARLNGIRYLASLKFGGTIPIDVSSALPELINLSRGGDDAASAILSHLKDLKVSGIPEEVGRPKKKARSRALQPRV
jgi:hypothetical protein